MNISAKVLNGQGKAATKVKIISLDSQRVFCVNKDGQIENYPRDKVIITDQTYLPV